MGRERDEHDPPPLSGERVAFTGRLRGMSRREAESVVRRLGGEPMSSVSRRTTMLVVGSRRLPIRPDGRISHALQRAESLRDGGAPIEIISEQRFLERLGAAAPAERESKTYDVEHVADVIGIEPASIRRWEAIGLIRSADDRYDFRDIVSLQNIVGLIRGGARVDAIAHSLNGLARVLPDVQHPLAQLNIVLDDGGDLLAQVGDVLVAPDGQQYFDFDADETPEPPPAPRRRTRDEWVAEEWFEEGLRCEDEERLEDAADAYREAATLRPDWADAYFNLGNALRAQQRFDAAVEIYRIALAHDPGNEYAWYNLADALIELGSDADAAACLERALLIQPDFADAHFNYAACLEEMDLAHEAREHWRAYIALDPHSTWADAARRRLDDPS